MQLYHIQVIQALTTEQKQRRVECYQILAEMTLKLLGIENNMLGKQKSSVRF